MRTLDGPTDHVVVVGAGLAGLSAALHLLGAGRAVTVVDRGTRPGGRAGRVERGGYHLDTGPTVLTMPDLVEDAFAAVGDRLADRLDLIPLHPAYRARFADGSALDVHTGADAMAAEVERFAGSREAHGYRRLRHWLEKLYAVQARRFIDANFDSPLSLLHPDLVRLAALGGFGRLDARVGSFISDERLRRIFSFQALYAGIPPAKALAAYAVIAYMDTVAGVCFPRGGMHALPRAMADAAADAGADFRYGHDVTRLERSGGGSGSGRRIRRWIRRPDHGGHHRTRRRPGTHPLRRGRPHTRPARHLPTARPAAAPPGAAAVLAVRGDPARRNRPHLAGTRPPHHLVRTRLEAYVPGTDAHREPHERPVPAHHPSHGHRPRPRPAGPPSALHSGALPQHPYRARRPGVGGPRPRYRDSLLTELERRGLDGLGAAIEEECLVTPADWTAEGHAAGTPFSAAHTFAQTGPFRPRNLVRGTTNAVLAGCGTTPEWASPPS